MPDPAPLLAEPQERRNSRGTAERLDPVDDAIAFAAVRSLLVGEERDDLDGLRARIDRIERDEADPELRGRRIAQVLGYAFEQAALHDGDRIGNVLGPAIGEGIRHQLEHDRPAMVAALVPMVGSLVAGAVAEAMDKMSNGIDDRMNRLFSLRGLRLALRAKLGGGSINDAILADLRRSAVERLYLFERATDRLVFTWPDRQEGTAPDDRTTDEILQSVLGLTGEILNAGDHALRSIAVGDRHLVIRAGATHTIVIEVSGALSDSRRAALGNACFEVLDFVSSLTDDIAGAELDPEIMGLYATRIMGRALADSAVQRREPRVSPARAIAATLAVAVLGAVGWHLYDGHRIQSRATAIEAALRAEFTPGALMLTVAADRGAGTIAVQGAAFTATDTDALAERARAQAAPYALAFDMATASPDTATPRLGALEARLSRLDAGTGNALTALDDRAGQGVAALSALQEPARLLSDFAAANAVFFATGTDPRDPARARADLDRLAALLSAAPDRPLRIVGYGDTTGSRATNQQVATARATTIAAELEARGIAPSRLIAFGRTGPEWAISPEDGPNSPNRRVEFQLGFTGERP